MGTQSERINEDDWNCFDFWDDLDTHYYGMEDSEGEIQVNRANESGEVRVYTQVPEESEGTEQEEVQGKGIKLDKEKPDLSLLLDFGPALEAVGHIATFGKYKYARSNWLQLDDAENRYTAAMLRHIMKENTGMYDSETEMLHAAHAAWNALARLTFILNNWPLHYYELGEEDNGNHST